MAKKKPPTPLKWGTDGSFPCVLNTAICFWIGTVHFVISGGHADFVLVALEVVAFTPWLGHIFKSVGKDGAKYWSEETESGSTERPPDPEASDSLGSGAPPLFRSAPGDHSIKARATKIAFFNLSWEGRKVLATLWRYQQLHFPAGKQGTWTFAVNQNTPEYLPFSRGVLDLAKHDLVGIADNGQAALTNNGLLYCRENSEVINGWEFVYDFS